MATALPAQMSRARPIDDKHKTGDGEQLGLIWTCHELLAQAVDPSSPAFIKQRKNFELDAVQRLTAEATAVVDMYGEHELGTPVLTSVSTLFTTIVGATPASFTQLSVGLALFNFRTGGGGRVRKTANWTRREPAASNVDSTFAPSFCERCKVTLCLN